MKEKRKLYKGWWVTPNGKPVFELDYEQVLKQIEDDKEVWEDIMRLDELSKK